MNGQTTTTALHQVSESMPCKRELSITFTPSLQVAIRAECQVHGIQQWRSEYGVQHNEGLRLEEQQHSVQGSERTTHQGLDKSDSPRWFEPLHVVRIDVLTGRGIQRKADVRRRWACFERLGHGRLAVMEKIECQFAMRPNLVLYTVQLRPYIELGACDWSAQRPSQDIFRFLLGRISNTYYLPCPYRWWS